MKILFLSEPSYPRHPGGSGKSTHLLAAGLAARGHAVRILCESCESTEREVIDGVEVHRLSWVELGALPPREREPAITRTILDYFDNELAGSPPDLLYDSGGFLSFFFPVAYKVRHRFRVPFVLHYRYLPFRHHAAMSAPGACDPFAADGLALEAKINESSQSFPARFADAVVCPSRDDAEVVQALFQPASGKPTLIPDPVQLTAPDAVARDALRAELLAPGEQLVFFGGRIDSDLKGGETVVAALERIVAQRPGVRLLLLVKEEAWTAPYRNRLGQRVIARPWIRDGAALATVLAASDLVVVPSRYESFGMMGAESLTVGTPVVASPVGAFPEMIRHGDNGFLLGPDRREWAAELADLALRILSDSALAQRMATTARASADAYRVDRIGARVEELCESVRRRTSSEGLADLQPPPFAESDRARYLDMVDALVGPEGRTTAEAVLAAWPQTAAARCLGCTRQRLAEDTRRLLRLGPGRWRRLWAKASGDWPSQATNAVTSACPRGLVERQRMKEIGLGGYGPVP